MADDEHVVLPPVARPQALSVQLMLSLALRNSGAGSGADTGAALRQLARQR
jgi:hypothetical protein